MPQSPEYPVRAGAREKLADRLRRDLGRDVYPASVVCLESCVIALVRGPEHKRLLVLPLGPRTPFDELIPGRSGTQTGHFELPLSAAVARIVRSELPWTAPSPQPLARSIGLGDRLGLATPGHVRAVRGSGFIPYFAQQSVREMTRTKRTPQDVIDAATWGVLETGWREGYGSDADHLKTTADIDACLEAGFTMFTIDPGEYVQPLTAVCEPSGRSGSRDASPAAPGADRDPTDRDPGTRARSSLDEALANLPWSALETTWADLRGRYLGRGLALDGGIELCFSEETLARAAIQYAHAIAHVLTMYRHLCARASRFELEVSIDETPVPTTVAEHYFVAAELKRLGVRWVGLAPRFPGGFEKAVDYRGDLTEFERSFAGHVAVARCLGPYRISIHSGSDKFAIYPIAGRLAGELLHVKTAGTSWLEALRVIARCDPGLFRDILQVAVARFESDRASYAVSARTEDLPAPAELSNDRLPELMDHPSARQVLHVTFGSVLTSTEGTPSLPQRISRLLRTVEEHHYTALAAHLGRHLAGLRG